MEVKTNQSQKKDMSPCWIQSVKHGHKICIPRYQLVQHKMKLDKNGDHLFVECDPEFVPKKRLNPLDDEKKHTAAKYANTDKTMRQITEITEMTHSELDAYAKQEGVSLSGAKNKREKLEKLEAAGKVY